MRGKLKFFGLVVVAGVAAGCGGGGGGSSTSPNPVATPTPAPTPLPPLVVAERTGWALPPDYIGWLPFPTSRAGILEATVDWTSEKNDLNVYLVKGDCNYDQLYAGQCQTLASAETNSKPEKLRYDSTQASTFTIFVDNVGPGDESLSFQVVLSASLSSSSAEGSPDAAVPSELRQSPRRGAVFP